jgi:Zn ribbon nucleic-acid-binding protein
MSNDLGQVFVHHAPCPKCHSRDNLGIYKDGHKYCFGCGYHVPAQRSLENSRPRKQEEGSNIAIFDRYRSVPFDDFPKEVKTWLKKYGLTQQEIQEYQFSYRPEQESLVIPVKWKGPILDVYQLRYFGDPSVKKPKYLTFGKLGNTELVVFGDPKHDTGIFVEDVVSAIKVARHYAAIPILGAHIPLGRLVDACKRFKSNGIWMDSDKVAKASKTVLQASAMFPKTRVFRVYSKKDPKEHSDYGVEALVKAARGD